MRKLLLLSALFASTAVGQAWAVCNPLDVCAKVTGLTDAALGTWGGSGDLSNNYTLCVYTVNDDESNYELTLTGDGAGNAFIASNGTSDVSITVEWDEDSDPSWTAMNPSIPATFTDPNILDENCAVGGDSAKVRVTVPEASMDAATSGAYTGTINVAVSAD